MATTVDLLHGPYTATVGPRAHVESFVWHTYAVVLAATMLVVGLIWDISWHMSIGRDTFWTPAHLLIQGGGLLAGLSSGAIALNTTFRGSDDAKQSSVRFWGFRAPYGAWVCVLGCGAMLTSAPFDDWWHGAYGLDVRIVSPPHILLGIGMMAIVLGAMLRTLALQNGDEERIRSRAALMFAWSSGLFITILGTLLLEWSDRGYMHLGTFYIAWGISVPIVLVGTTVSGRSRWPAATAALIYMTVLALTSWILMLFPATPKLGPIYRDITHFVPLDFPILLVFPALAIDLTWRRVREWPVLRASAALGIAFMLTLMLVQWPFSSFLMANGRNWFFHTDNFVYWQDIASEHFSFQFYAQADDAPPLIVQFAYSIVAAVIASLVGLLRGRWMTRVRR
ncbi:MAG: hypothetical protein V4550_13610 [Gemmatimonadota bacterium]